MTPSKQVTWLAGSPPSPFLHVNRSSERDEGWGGGAFFKLEISKRNSTTNFDFTPPLTKKNKKRAVYHCFK